MSRPDNETFKPPQRPDQAPPEGLLAQLSAGLTWLEEMLLVVLFLSLLGMGLSQIIMRNFWDTSSADVEVLIRALVLWTALLGAAIAARRKRHIVVDLLSHYLKPRAVSASGFLANLFTCVICLMIAWAGLKMIQLELGFNPVAMFGPLPRWLVQLPMPLAFAVMASQFLMHALEDLIAAVRPS